MAKKKRVPELRFSEFAEEWKEAIWNETVDISKDMVDPRLGYYDDLPHIGPGNIESFTGEICNKVSTVKQSNLISGKFHFYHGDIIYGKINPQLAKYTVAQSEGLASADTYILRSKNGIDQRFLFRIIQTADFYQYSCSVSKRTGMPKINRDELNIYKFFSPGSREQNKISHFLYKLDSYIILQQRKYTKICLIKNSLLEKMFSNDDIRIPKIRFSNFCEKWKALSIGDVIEDYVERTTIQNQYPVLTSSQQQGIVLQKDYFDNRQVTTDKNIGYFVLPRNYFTYRSRSDTNIFVFNRNQILDKGIISYYYPVFTVKGIDPNFFLRRINNGMLKQLTMAAEGTGQHVLAHAKFKNMKTYFPSFVEQSKIGLLFESLDNLISLQKRKLEKLKCIKKSCLDKMFV